MIKLLRVAVSAALPAASLSAAPQVITLEGEVVEAQVDTISAGGTARAGDGQWPLDGPRSIAPAPPAETEDASDGRVVLICGSEIAASGIALVEEEIVFQSPGFGEWTVPIDAVRALRFGELQRGSRFQKGLLEWEASRDYDTIFISGGAELQETEGLIEEIDEVSLIFDRDGKLQTVPRARAYGVVLASPLLQEGERPACSVSLAGGTRLRADIVGMADGRLKLALVEGIELDLPWSSVRRVGIRSARLAYLSDIDEVRSGLRPIIAPRRPWQRDRSVSGLPIRIGEQTYDKGLGLAAGTFVTFPNDGPYDLLLAEIGIDSGARGRGDCEFVVESGERELFRQRARGGEPPQLIRVDITGCSEVTLRVDAGEDLDLSDHANWGDACFLQRVR